MLKRSLIVLMLVLGGVALGVLITGVLNLRSPVPKVEAVVAPPGLAPQQEPLRTTPPAVETPPPGRVEAGKAEPRQPAPGVNGGLKVGVVNLKQCFDENAYEYAKEVTEQLKKLEAEIMKSLQDLEKQMKETKEKRDGLPKNSGLWQEKARALKLLEVQYELDGKLGRAKFVDQYSKLKLEVYAEIRRVIDIYGKDKKFDLILRVEEPQLEDDSPTTVSQQINQRVVLFFNDPLDVTKDVLKLLNSEYAKRKATPAPAAGECPKCKIKTNDAKCPSCGAEIPKPK